MPGFVGLPEIILFGIVALLIFGPKKLPEMGRSLGKGLREFKDSVSSDSKDAPEEVAVIAQIRAGDDDSNPFADEAPVTTAVNGSSPAR